MLSELCDNFALEVEALDPSDDAYGADLRRLVRKLARDAAGHIGDYALGEVAALCQRCYEVLAALSAEADDAEDRQRKYDRQQATLNLLVLAEGVGRFHTRPAREELRTSPRCAP